jgi:hypothetical protein
LTAGRPAETSDDVRVMIGLEPWARATALRPRLVAIPMGMPNQAMPPQRKALTLVLGSEAMARCQ